MEFFDESVHYLCNFGVIKTNQNHYYDETTYFYPLYSNIIRYGIPI